MTVSDEDDHACSARKVGLSIRMNGGPSDTQ
jgi:hypothetical protein